MTKNLNDNLQEEMNHANYKPYANSSSKKTGLAFVIEGVNNRSYHLYYHQLRGRKIEKFSDKDTGKDVITFTLFTSSHTLCLFLVGFDNELYTKFEEDFINQHVLRIFEYSGDVEKASKPVIMVKDLDETHSSWDETPDTLSSAIAKFS